MIFSSQTEALSPEVLREDPPLIDLSILKKGYQNNVISKNV